MELMSKKIRKETKKGKIKKAKKNLYGKEKQSTSMYLYLLIYEWSKEWYNEKPLD